MMTDTTVSSRVLGAAWPQHFNKVVAETAYANIKAVGMPTWDDADLALAKAVQRELKQAERGLETEVGKLGEPVRDEDNRGGGSDDIGDVSWVVPTITLRYPANIPGTTGHHWSSGIAMATPIAHKGCAAGAKVHALTMLDLLLKPALVKAGVGVLPRVQTKELKYTPLVRPQDKPATFLNAKIMAVPREMRPFYFGPGAVHDLPGAAGRAYPAPAGHGHRTVASAGSETRGHPHDGARGFSPRAVPADPNGRSQTARCDTRAEGPSCAGERARRDRKRPASARADTGVRLSKSPSAPMRSRRTGGDAARIHRHGGVFHLLEVDVAAGRDANARAVSPGVRGVCEHVHRRRLVPQPVHRVLPVVARQAGLDDGTAGCSVHMTRRRRRGGQHDHHGHGEGALTGCRAAGGRAGAIGEGPCGVDGRHDVEHPEDPRHLELHGESHAAGYQRQRREKITASAPSPSISACSRAWVRPSRRRAAYAAAGVNT